MAADMAETLPITVKILDKEYRVACPEDERHALMAAASFLDRRMRELRESGRVVGLDRIAVIAGLNLANELLQCQTRGQDFHKVMGSRLRAINKRVASLLEPA